MEECATQAQESPPSSPKTYHAMENVQFSQEVEVSFVSMQI